MAAQLRVLDHPLVAHRVAGLRSSTTNQAQFGRLASEITTFLAVEAFAELPTEAVVIDTPVSSGVVAEQVTEELLLIPVLRAGLGLIPALQAMLPVTRVCLIGMRRDEATFEAEIYLDGLPRELSGTKIVVCDPMLATGGSLIQVVDLLKERGATDVTVLCLIASAPGVEAFGQLHPDVLIVTAALDEVLNERGYIVPGLGDAGDRLFGAPVRR